MEAPYLKKHYQDTVVKQLREKRGYKNLHEVPKIVKVVLNSGVKATVEKKWIDEVRNDISAIAGQRALVTRARKSVSNFKLREGMPVGVAVTLRGARMYDFLLRFLAVALPNIRDFRGVHKKLDGRGNYSIGIADHTIFPEIPSDTGGKATIGLDVTIVTSATTDAEAYDLLDLMGMPFRKQPKTETVEPTAA